MNVKANAPILHINSLAIDDSEGGDGDGELDPGETAGMTISYSNTGHSVAYDVDVYLEAQTGFIDVLNPDQNFPAISMLGNFEKTYDVTVDADSPEGILVNFQNDLSMGDLTMNKDFPTKISALSDDFETGDFSKFNWQQGGDLPWQITYQYVYEGYYCIKSGAIGDNQASQISLTYASPMVDRR